MPVTTSLEYDIARVLDHADAYFNAFVGPMPMKEEDWAPWFTSKRLEFTAARKLLDSDDYLTMDECWDRLKKLADLFQWLRDTMKADRMPLTVADIDSVITTMRDLIHENETDREIERIMALAADDAEETLAYFRSLTT